MARFAFKGPKDFDLAIWNQKQTLGGDVAYLFGGSTECRVRRLNGGGRGTVTWTAEKIFGRFTAGYHAAAAAVVSMFEISAVELVDRWSDERARRCECVCVCACVHKGRLRMNVSGARPIIYTTRSRSPRGREGKSFDRAVGNGDPSPSWSSRRPVTLSRLSGRRRGRGTRAHPALPTCRPTAYDRRVRRARRETPVHAAVVFTHRISAHPHVSDFRSIFFSVTPENKTQRARASRSVENRFRKRPFVRCERVKRAAYDFFFRDYQ